MKNVIETLRYRKDKLSQSSFCQTVSNQSIPVAQRLVFIPDMCFFILGFKDMMMALEDKNNPDKCQKIVNQHALEDNYHWKWYLQDLETINKNIYKVELEPHQIWSDDNWPIRVLVYDTMKVIKNVESPFVKLAVLQVLESTFETFRDAFGDTIRSVPFYNDLAYFGDNHLQAEEDHEYGDWLEYDMNALAEDFKEYEGDYEQASAVINELYDAFEGMFNRFNDLIKEKNVHAVN